MGDRLRAPWPWYGSKLGAAALIEQLHGPVNNFVVPFAGSLGELLGRSQPAKVETINDLDGHVVNAWRAIKYSPERLAELCDYPVHEVTLHARHDKLVHARTTKGRRKRALKSGRRKTMPLAEYLRTDDRAHDVRVAAQWIWGASCWLGSGWCKEPSRSTTRRQTPHLSGGAGRPGHGKGIHAKSGVGKTWQARPQLSHGGQGVITPRQMPMISGSYTGHPAFGNGVHSSAHREALVEWFLALADRIRWTRIICGDWRRAVTKAVTTSHGVTGINFDPTYDLQATGRSSRLYRKDDPRLSTDVRAWALEHGEDPLLRITVNGKYQEHDELLEHGWTKHVWRKDGETIWASPTCQTAAVEFGPLFSQKSRVNCPSRAHLQDLQDQGPQQQDEG